MCRHFCKHCAFFLAAVVVSPEANQPGMVFNQPLPGSPGKEGDGDVGFSVLPHSKEQSSTKIAKLLKHEEVAEILATMLLPFPPSWVSLT